jgi:hypothetical protein
MTKKTCIGCSYYELTCIDIFPFEYCYKHNKKNKKPNDFIRCDSYTTSKLIKVKVLIKSIRRMFKAVI